jgi:heme A synthase
MENQRIDRSSERGAAAVKIVLVFLVLILGGYAGANYVPVAYNGASFRQEMDTAVVKALGSSGNIKPMDVVVASITKATRDHDLPQDTFVDIRPVNGVIHAHVSYTQKVNMLPFGLYRYDYNFDHTAKPTGYLLKE